MKLVQPPEWYEKNIRDIINQNPDLYTSTVQCIHCEKDMEVEGTIESPICDVCWEEMWEEREKEKSQPVFIDEDGVEYPTDYTIYLRK